MTIYALHDFKEQADWFYVRQEGQLRAGGNYHPCDVKDFLGAGYHWEGYYIGNYTMDNWIAGVADPAVQMFRSSPSTEPPRQRFPAVSIGNSRAMWGSKARSRPVMSD